MEQVGTAPAGTERLPEPEPFIYPIGCGKVVHPRGVNCPTTQSSSGDGDSEELVWPQEGH